MHTQPQKPRPRTAALQTFDCNAERRRRKRQFGAPERGVELQLFSSKVMSPHTRHTAAPALSGSTAAALVQRAQLRNGARRRASGAARGPDRMHEGHRTASPLDRRAQTQAQGAYHGWRRCERSGRGACAGRGEEWPLILSGGRRGRDGGDGRGRRKGHRLHIRTHREATGGPTSDRCLRWHEPLRSRKAREPELLPDDSGFFPPVRLQLRTRLFFFRRQLGTLREQQGRRAATESQASAALPSRTR